MNDDPRKLKDQLRRIGLAKDATRADDAEAWLALPLDDRVAATLRHCDALLALSPPDPTVQDDEHEVWARVNRYLQTHR